MQELSFVSPKSRQMPLLQGRKGHYQREQKQWQWCRDSSCSCSKHAPATAATAPTTATATTSPASAPAPAVVSSAPAKAGRKFSFLFWLVTIAVSACAMYLLSLDVFPQCWYWLLGDDEYIRLGTISSCIGGMLGCGVFNLFWAPGRKTGKHKLWEYALSLLCAMCFAWGCLALVVIVALVLVILGVLLIIAFFWVLSND